MRKVKFIFTLLAALAIVTSCKEDIGFFNKEDIVYGAYMNVVSITSGSYLTQVAAGNPIDGTTSFILTVEARDAQKGALLETYDFYVTHRDNNAGNGTKPAVETFVKSIPASAFTVDAGTGYPRTTITITAAEVITALGGGYTTADINGGDNIDFREVLVLTDGREFTNTSSGIVTGGAFFTSPFFHRLPVACPSNIAGTYATSSINIVAGPGGDAASCPSPMLDAVTFTAVAGSPGKYKLSDGTFGQYFCAWYGDSDATSSNGVFFSDTCGKIAMSGSDQYGLIYFCAYVSGAGTANLVIDWGNDYGDAGRTTLIHPSGVWPANFN